MKKKSKYEILEEIQENLKDENGEDPLEGMFFDCNLDNDDRNYDPNEIVYPGQTYLDNDDDYKLSPKSKIINAIVSFLVGLLLLGIPVLLIVDFIKIF